jgi:cytochrome c553
LLLLGGCPSEAFDSIPPGQRGAVLESVQEIHRGMHLRFEAARRIQEAIARSDLDRARIEAHALADLDEPKVLPEWRPYVDEIRRAAQQIESAGNTVAAARLAAALGQRCASCHEAVRARIAFPDEPRPPEGSRLAPQMASHQWAAARMWEGLIGPSDEHWLVGARALASVPLNTVAQSVTPSSDLDVDDVARIRLYATRARAAMSNDARAEVYGHLLATCAHCHAVLRDR